MVSSMKLKVKESFTQQATVENIGVGRAGRDHFTISINHSTIPEIEDSDTRVGTYNIVSLSPSGERTKSDESRAPRTEGTYYYGACVDSVPGETNTDNNCSSGVEVTVDKPKCGFGTASGTRCRVNLPTISTTSEGYYITVGGTEVTLYDSGGCSSYSQALLTDRSKESDSGEILIDGLNLCVHAAEFDEISWRPGSGFY